MYQTLEKLYKFYPNLLTEKQKIAVEELNAIEEDYYSKSNLLTASYYKEMKEEQQKAKDNGVSDIGLFMVSSRVRKSSYPNEELNALFVKMNMEDVRAKQEEIENSVFDKLSLSCKLKLSSAEEALITYLKLVSIIQDWFNDVRIHQKELSDKGLSEHSTQAGKNYWFYMEWQNDFYPLGLVLFELNGNKVPNYDGYSPFDAYEGLNMVMGIEDYHGNDYRKIANRLKHNITTAVAWAFDESQDWILKGQYPNTNQEDFEKQIEYLFALYNFIVDTKPDEALLEKAIYKRETTLDRIILSNFVADKFVQPEIIDFSSLAVEVKRAMFLLANFIKSNEDVSCEEHLQKYLAFTRKEQQEKLYELGIAYVILNQMNPLLTDIQDGLSEVLNLVEKWGSPFYIEDRNLYLGSLLAFNKNVENSIIFISSNKTNNFALEFFFVSQYLEKFARHLRDIEQDYAIYNCSGNYYSIGTRVNVNALKEVIEMPDEEKNNGF